VENTGKFPCIICRKGVGTNTSGVLHATCGYIGNVAVLGKDCKVCLPIDVEGVCMVILGSQKC